MAQREPTANEKLFLIQKSIESAYRRGSIQAIRDLLYDPELDAIDAQELVEEIFEGTRFELRGDVDYREEGPE